MLHSFYTVALWKQSSDFFHETCLIALLPMTFSHVEQTLVWRPSRGRWRLWLQKYIWRPITEEVYSGK